MLYFALEQVEGGKGLNVLWKAVPFPYAPHTHTSLGMDSSTEGNSKIIGSSCVNDIMRQ